MTAITHDPYNLPREILDKDVSRDMAWFDRDPDGCRKAILARQVDRFPPLVFPPESDPNTKARIQKIQDEVELEEKGYVHFYAERTFQYISNDIPKKMSEHPYIRAAFYVGLLATAYLIVRK